MALWLLKTEPEAYSYQDLERDGETVWDGITNALALKNLRTFQTSDRVLLYHTGKEKAVVGEVAVVSVQVEPLMIRIRAIRIWPQSVSLQQIKADALLASCELVRLPRLSVVPITTIEWDRLEFLGGVSSSSPE